MFDIDSSEKIKRLRMKIALYCFSGIWRRTRSNEFGFVLQRGKVLRVVV